MKNLTHVAGRIFGTPLMIQRAKLDQILGFLAPRIQGVNLPEPEAIQPNGSSQQRKPYEVMPDGTAVISILGSLVHRGTSMDAYSGLTSYAQLEYEFNDAISDSAITGILLDCDSPGGEVSGCFDFADRIFWARGTKPIVALANDSCFSACYAIASAADKVLVTRTAGVGSIGVIAMFLDQSGLDAQVGLRYTAIFSGDHKNDYDPHSPLSDDAKAALQASCDTTRDLFVETVARNRGMKVTDVFKTQAGIFWGADAIAAGLADQVIASSEALDVIQSLQVDPKLLSLPSASAGGISQHAERNHMKENINSAGAPNQNTGTGGTPDTTALTADAFARGKAEGVVEGRAAASAEGHAAGYAEAQEIFELCALGKNLKAAGQFFAVKAKPADVRGALLADGLKADAETAVVSLVNSASSTNTGTQKAANDALMADVERRREAAANNRKGVV